MTTTTYSISETAFRTGLTEAALRQRVGRGLIPVKRTETGRIRIASDVLEALRHENAEHLADVRRELEWAASLAGLPTAENPGSLR